MLQTDLRKSLRASLSRKKKPLISINQMAQYNSYYNIKSLGSAEEMTQFMESVQRKQSVLSSCLLPLSVPSGITADQANTLKTGVVRKMTVNSECLCNIYTVNNWYPEYSYLLIQLLSFLLDRQTYILYIQNSTFHRDLLVSVYSTAKTMFYTYSYVKKFN